MKITTVPLIVSINMNRKYLVETVSRRDVAAEPPWKGSRRVSTRYFRFISVINNGFRYRHWHRDLDCIGQR
jgi:hypothetical protein